MRKGRLTSYNYWQNYIINRLAITLNGALSDVYGCSMVTGTAEREDLVGSTSLISCNVESSEI